MGAWGFALLVSLLAVLPARAQDRVVLQLQWDNQFQFAGYYAALWQGYYREAGLDVEIRSAFPDGGGPLRSPVREVSEGRAQFGTSNAGVLLALSGGARIVVVASIFQQSGTRLYYRRDLDVRSLADLVSLRLGRNQGNELLDMELRAMLAAEGIDPARLNVVLKAPNRLLQAMAEGEYDMTFGYILSAPFEMRELGLDFAEMRPSDYGIAFYGDSLITSPELAAQNPELVQRFKDATLRGWRYALDNADAMAERIARDLPRYLPIQDRLGFNRFMVPIVRELTLHPIVDLGNINPERWRLMAQQLVRARVLPEVPDLSNFVFDPDKDRSRRAEATRRFLAISATVTLLAALLAFAWVMALRRAVAGARKRLEQSQEALLQARKLEAVGQMTGGVAHDFNNLLQVVASGLTLLERPNTDESRRRAVLTAMRRAVERGTRIAAGMLAFARRKSFVPERIAPSARLPAMRDLIEGALRGDIVLRMDVPPDLWPVDADATQLEIALLNLAVNARDAMPKGGTLTLSARNRTMPAGGDLSGDAVEVAVADTGTGMSREALARAFEPFFTTKPVGKGTGLGLAQVYGFARGSGGTVQSRARRAGARRAGARRAGARRSASSSPARRARRRSPATRPPACPPIRPARSISCWSKMMTESRPS
ncbi:ABC transporter substrate-binding protein [Roseomonas sp. CCTCC AB2023176]|uniref:ABC transporter substrate-binding protein n=1 Tax=Roseomonas sp. CCTCC AB2023176 TaxID=3342640 RepID=UPI0035DAAA94